METYIQKKENIRIIIENEFLICGQELTYWIVYQCNQMPFKPKSLIRLTG